MQYIALRRLLIFYIWMILGAGLVFSPALASADDQSPDLVVLTYNILYNNADLTAISEVIRASGADVVLLQEVTAALARDLPPLLADIYPYSAMNVAVVRRLGLGVLSRSPLQIEAFRPEISLDSSSLYLKIDLDGIPVTIYNVHLANPLTGSGFRYNAMQHHQSVTWLLDLLALEQSDQPMIVAGDFNFSDFSADYTRMTEHLTDSFSEANDPLNFGFTFSAAAPFPLLRLDYLFHNDSFMAQNATVGSSSGGSDHYPLRVELTLS